MAAVIPDDPRRLRTVLVVDDHTPVRIALRSFFGHLGIRVLTAADGKAALRVYQEAGAVDLVLLDLVMPGMDGTETYRRLREIDPGARVLFMSGYTSPEPMPAGSLGLLPKPVDPDRLRRVVLSHLGQRAPRHPRTSTPPTIAAMR